MSRFILLLFFISTCLLVDCSDSTSPQPAEPTLLLTFTGTEERLEVNTVANQYMSEYGYCCEGRVMPFDIHTDDDPRLCGRRTHIDSMYAQDDGTFRITGTFSLVNDGGTWTGTLEGALDLSGVHVDLKGYGQGNYQGLYFEMTSYVEGDPTTPTGTGWFEGSLYQLH